MTCKKVIPMLSRLLDRELSPREAAEVEHHLAECPRCRSLARHWRLQGSYLRAYLSRMALGEDFVRSVTNAAASSTGRLATMAARRSNRRKPSQWLPAAAAVLAAVVLFGLLTPSREGIGYARVINPGDCLEVLSSTSPEWVRTSAGKLLNPGDWLRNRMPADAEIQWPDSRRLVLRQGTLARIPDGPGSFPAPLIMLSGALGSDAGDGAGDFRVRTPAGTVTAGGGSFTLRLRDLTLPKLQFPRGSSEVLTGAVLAVGEVTVRGGRVSIDGGGAVREVLAGETATFAEPGLTNGAMHPGIAPASVRVVANSGEPGSLSAFLTSAGPNLHVDLEATNVSLKRLLECATGVGVRGGDTITVSGNLNFIAGSSPESVATAVGRALHLPIFTRYTTVRQAAALVPQQAPMPDWLPGSFRLERSEDGAISFDFRKVPAVRAMQILRSLSLELPEISTESQGFPVTFQASALRPESVKAWVAGTLGLQYQTVEVLVEMIEVGNAPASSPEAGGQTPAAAPLNTPRSSPAADRTETTSRSSTSLPRSGTAGIQSLRDDPSAGFVAGKDARLPVMGSVWSVLDGSAYRQGAGAIHTSPGGGTDVANGKVTPKGQEYFFDGDTPVRPQPTTHLVWPSLGQEEAFDAADPYWIINPTGLPAHTIWSGYDRGGRLLAQVAVYVNPSSTLGLSPLREFPARVGAGGHWETLSDVPVVGTRGSEPGQAGAISQPVEAERLCPDWSFPAAWLLRLGGRLWLVNPGNEPLTIIASIWKDGKPGCVRQFLIVPKGGIFWPEFAGAAGPDVSAAAGGTIVLIHALQGSVAAGLAR